MSSERVAAVTGANRGLGKETARQLATKGYRVLLLSRDLERGRTAAAEIGDLAEAVCFDVTNPEHVAPLREHVEKIGRLDALVNCAGVSGEAGFMTSVLDIDFGDLDRTLDINLKGAIRASSAVVPLMKRQGTGCIVNVSSGMGQLSDMASGAPVYRFSKTSLNAFTRILSRELSKTKIRVNSVCPGWVRTDMGGPNAKLGVEEGAAGIVWAATLEDDGPSGGFFRHGEAIDW